MKYKSKSSLGSLLMLLLIIPLSLGIYYTFNYLLDDIQTSDSEPPAITDKGVSVYIDSKKIKDIPEHALYEHTLLIPDIGDTATIDFKHIDTEIDYNKKIIYSMNDEAENKLKITKQYSESGTYFTHTVRLQDFTTSARITFTDENYSFYLRLTITAEIIEAETIIISDITFYE